MATTTIVTDRGMREARAHSDQRSLTDRLFATTDSVPLLITRLGLGLVILPHGLQKMFGWFGGGGFSATMESFTAQMGIPVIFAFLAIMAEFLGSLGLIFGFLSRIAAFGILCNMTVAALLVHLPVGFFMNWSGQLQGEGYEFHLLAIALALSVIVGGAGRFSIDRNVFNRRKVRELDVHP